MINSFNKKLPPSLYLKKPNIISIKNVSILVFHIIYCKYLYLIFFEKHLFFPPSSPTIFHVGRNKCKPNLTAIVGWFYFLHSTVMPKIRYSANTATGAGLLHPKSTLIIIIFTPLVPFGLYFPIGESR